MPHQNNATKTHLDDIIACLTPTVALLNEVTDAFGTPFMRAISSTTVSLITAMQNVRSNRDECIGLMENIHGIIYAIINLHIKSETVGSLAPAIQDHIGKFTETLHKIHTFLEAQQDGNKIKYFFRQNQMNTLCKECHAGLDEALKVFQVEIGLLIADNVVEMQKKTESMHQELLELIENLSDGLTSDGSSSPKIFHGRQSELEDILTNLEQESVHIAILGPGGIGKTSLARAALHHPQVAAKFENRFFIAADSATTGIELAALTGSHLGLKKERDLTKAVVQFLSQGPPCLLVLDNLEAPWEPLQSRGGVEEFLSRLTDIPHLALIITMRGAERPAKVQWTHPFLEPLKPLSYDAARQTFIEIADDFHDSKDIDQLLQLTDNMPLAVDLIAHLVDYEGSSNVLARWETEKTSLLSAGFDKQSSLDASITMSLASPRMLSCPGAKELLSLLSILPDGLSDVELVECDLPIPDLLTCRATLLCTSLAYYDGNKRLNRLTGHVNTGLMEHIQAVLPVLCDHQIKAKYVIEMLLTANDSPVADPELLIHEGVAHFNHFNNPVLEFGNYYCLHKNDLPTAAQSFEKAVSLAKLCGDSRQHSVALNWIAWLKFSVGNYSAGQMHAREAKQIAQLSGNLHQEAVALGCETTCLIGLGNFKESVFLGQRARELLKLCGMQGCQTDIMSMLNLADIHRLKSEYLEARNIYVELGQNISAQQDPFNYASHLLNIADVDIMIGGDAVKVEQNLDNAKAIFMTLRESNITDAKNLLGQCLTAAWGNSSETVSYCLERLANAICMDCDILGTCTKNTGKASTSQSTLLSLEGFNYMDVHRSRANCMLRLGDIAKNRGDLVKAVELWKEARPLFERSSQAKDIVQVDTRLASVDQIMLDIHQKGLAVLSELE
ncbi:hypothetical protein C8R44DRAFT_753318 [Mycena epipterygia]|nr:hypothetical protein C8R44DRAFT_753318 [Mycena epipterygia]